MRTLLLDPGPATQALPDPAHREPPLPRADEPAVRSARGERPAGRLAGVRRSVLISFGLHALAVGFALWHGLLPEAPRPVTLGASIAFRPAEAALEPEPVVEVDFDELVELDEPPPPEPVLPESPAARPDETFEPLELVEPPPLQTMEVPLRVARLRVPRKRPPTIAVRTAPAPSPPVARPPVAAPRPRPPAPAPVPRRAASRPGPMRIVYAPDARSFYPSDARRRGVTGVVSVYIVVDARGAVTSASVIRSSGDASLDAAATRLVRAYRFTPGVGLRSARLPIAFRLL
jgi:protein TonB